ncbi:Retrovirus-related Pol polyprotein from transposon 297 [Araneus ventricosus]|uniref:RNA-directed DNA polymerase n=1 Tax=Araneus ventricosus TaxID=182803 RepID=A0A4Y2R455_ARAVE|nr:Retrovirus-related Pol polyprotein from transposon 297 [Araneus ventricosus]
MTQHRINTGDHPPIKQYPRRLPLARKEEAEHLVKEMVDNGIIEESSGPWVSSLVLVKQKDGSTRFYDTLDASNGSQWFTTLDLKSGYWQVEDRPEDREIPATFERLVETVLRGLSSEACLVYLDDIIIVERRFEEHQNNLRKVFQRLKKANLKLNPKKCRFYQKEVTYLGHVISAEGVKTDPRKIKAVVDWPRPETVHDLRSFLGLCTYYRRVVKNFCTIARPLHKLNEAKSNFNWTEECEKSFNSLKQALTSSPILTYPRAHSELSS